MFDGVSASDKALDSLLGSDETSVRLKTLVGVSGRPANDPEVQRTLREVAGSERVRTLLSERRPDGTIPSHPYRAKWYGAHWVLVALADLGYPAGDRSLLPLREQILGWLFSEEYVTKRIGRVRGLTRIHASIDGNAAWALLTLQLADRRVEELVSRLIDSQWPDGGWNCDRKATGRTSSFTESLIPLRALALHARLRGSRDSREASERAAEVFLSRRLFRRHRNGRVIHPSFVKLHYPWYWHYDILFGLKVMAEAGVLADSRCSEALDLLESKRLSDGGFPAEARYYRPTKDTVRAQRSLVDWGGVSAHRMNEWVTVEAMSVLRTAGRLTLPAESVRTASTRAW